MCLGTVLGVTDVQGTVGHGTGACPLPGALFVGLLCLQNLIPDLNRGKEIKQQKSDKGIMKRKKEDKGGKPAGGLTVQRAGGEVRSFHLTHCQEGQAESLLQEGQPPKAFFCLS